MASSSSTSSPNQAMAEQKPNSQTHPNNNNNNNNTPLKCPRCDSSNTKFCYYNNYSLSQPRHFCKGCKRYWTRGGTLRNVPVGGGCRKNKRMKRPTTISSSSAAAAVVSENPSFRPPPQISMDLLSPSASSYVNNNNHLFYNPMEINFPFSTSSFSSTRVSDFHLPQSQINGVGLGFSSSTAGNNDSILFGSSSSFSTTSTMASLLASSFQHQKSGFSNLMPYEDVKTEGDQNGFMWGPNMNPNPNTIDQQINHSDPSSLLWNTNNIGAWFDPNSNMGASVPSLI